LEETLNSNQHQAFPFILLDLLFPPLVFMALWICMLKASILQCC